MTFEQEYEVRASLGAGAGEMTGREVAEPGTVAQRGGSWLSAEGFSSAKRERPPRTEGEGANHAGQGVAETWKGERQGRAEAFW